MQEVFNVIKDQTKDMNVDEVEQLILDECHFKQFSALLKSEIEKYKNLIYLSLNDCQLKSLENFPNLPNLIKLDLLDNQLSGETLVKIASQSSLQQLALGGNPIKTFDEIKFLQKLTDLKEVDFIQCPISESQVYREKIFELLKGLEVLDNLDQEGNQISEDNDDDEENDQDEDDDEDDDDDEDEDEDEEEDYEEDEDDESDDQNELRKNIKH